MENTTVEQTATKRHYKHSEAWLKAHEEKLAKHLFEKKMAMKSKDDKKSLSKELTCQANDALDEVRHCNSDLKKSMKALAKALDEVYKAGDEKTISRVCKRVAAFGLDLSDGALNVKNTIKIKHCPNADGTSDAEIEEAIADADAADDEDEAAVSSIPDAIEDLADEDLEDEADESLEDDEDDEDLEGLDEDEKAQRREDRRLAREYERECRGESDDTMADAMRENGDWD